MNCEERQERLERIAFEGDTDALVDEEREHLETCAPCRSHFALVQQLIGEARDPTPAPLSPELRASVHERAIRALRAGQLWINDTQAAPLGYPAGGYKQSGFGREGGREGLVDFTELKAIYLRLDR